MTVGDIYLIAGTPGTAGYSGDGASATSADLDEPGGVAVDSHGNVIIADTVNRRIRVVSDSTATYYGVPMTSGDIYTVAGNGTIYYSGDGGSATSSEIGASEGIAVDSNGDQVIADSHNEVIRFVPATSGTNFGTSMTGGDIYTVAGNGTAGFSGNGAGATSAELDDPGGVAVDSHGNILIADYYNCEVRAVAGTTGTFYGVSMSTVGDIYDVAGDGTCGDTTGVATSSKIEESRSVAIDANGNLVIADTAGCYIKVVAATTGSFYNKSMTAGHIYDVAGNGACGNSANGTAATSAKVDDPDGVALDSSGNIVIADTGDDYIKVVAESTATFYGVAMTVNKMYHVAGTGSGTYSGDGGVATSAALDSPFGVAGDSSGNIAIGDELNERVRVIAGTTGTFYGVSMTAGDIYTVAGDGTNGFTGDGGAATSAEIYDPLGVAVDSSGDLFIADYGNDRIREVIG
jgi:hypothetical protein